MITATNSPSLGEIKYETEAERQTIQSLPYRTTQLVFPNPKVKPDLCKTDGFLPTWGSHQFMRPLEHQKSIEKANLNSKQKYRLAQGQHSFDKAVRDFYTDMGGLKEYEPVYVQTGLPPPQQYEQHPGRVTPLSPQPASFHNLEPPTRRTPDQLPPFNRQNSPTYKLIMEDEVMTDYPTTDVVYLDPPTQTGKPQLQKNQNLAKSTQNPHSANNYRINFDEVNSVGMPIHRIPQSQSFNRLRRNVMVMGLYA